MTNVLGLDIGGASLKCCVLEMESAKPRPLASRQVVFPLWKSPEQLAEQLEQLVAGLSVEAIAVTMTGELCDCFATKQEGVTHIASEVARAFPNNPIAFWSTKGFLPSNTIDAESAWQIASANWFALADWCRRLLPVQFSADSEPCIEPAGLLIDMGSTTTDIIPLTRNHVIASGQTDPERLQTGELVYVGASRSPVNGILQSGVVDGIKYRVANEFFATSLDALLLLGMVNEDPNCFDTADGKPATLANAHARLARVICSDPSRFSLAHARELAQQIMSAISGEVTNAITEIVARINRPINLIITSGQGESVVHRILDHSTLQHVDRLSLKTTLDEKTSSCACAYAVAMLYADQLTEHARPRVSSFD